MPRCGEATCGRWRPAIGARLLGGTQLNGCWYCSPACLESAIRRGLVGPGETAGAGGARGGLRLGATRSASRPTARMVRPMSQARSTTDAMFNPSAFR